MKKLNYAKNSFLSDVSELNKNIISKLIDNALSNINDKHAYQLYHLNISEINQFRKYLIEFFNNDYDIDSYELYHQLNLSIDIRSSFLSEDQKLENLSKLIKYDNSFIYDISGSYISNSRYNLYALLFNEMIKNIELNYLAYIDFILSELNMIKDLDEFNSYDISKYLDINMKKYHARKYNQFKFSLDAYDHFKFSSYQYACIDYAFNHINSELIHSINLLNKLNNAYIELTLKNNSIEKRSEFKKAFIENIELIYNF